MDKIEVVEVVEADVLGVTLCFLCAFLIVYYVIYFIKIEHKDFESKNDLLLSFIPFYMWVKHIKTLYKELS